MGKNLPTIEILDSIQCKCNPEARKLIKPYLKYENSYFKRSKFGGKNIITDSYLITGRDGSNGLFYTGLFPMIKKNLLKKQIKIEIKGKIDKFKPVLKIFELEKIIKEKENKIFRTEQKNALKKIRRKQRGRIILPTSYGKSLIATCTIMMFQNLRILFLCHTKDLVQQNSEILKKYNIEHFIQDMNNKINWDNIHNLENVVLLSTIQSLSRIPKEYWHLYFDIIIVDEAHHVSNLKSQYGKLLTTCLAPIRIGLTATEPTKQYEKLINEALFGPILTDIKNIDAIEEGALAKPIIDLKPIPFNNKINSKCKAYKDFYNKGIIKNKIRNEIIINEAINSKNNDEISLIMIENIKHAKILQKLFLKENIRVPFVYGDIKDKNKRLKIKNDLENGNEKIAICTKVWREGISITSLNKIIYASGMKDEKLVKQALGRGQRTNKNKKDVVLIDFLDPYKYLAEHAIQRISIYIKEKWL